MSSDSRRSAVIYIGAMGLAIWLGYYARQYALEHPVPAADCAGDTFWALAVFATLGWLFPTMPTWQATSGAFIIPAVLKLGQIAHAPWVDPIVGTPVGFLVLGTDFLTTDLACYAAGAAIGMALELILLV
jgi:hypothetical protein